MKLTQPKVAAPLPMARTIGDVVSQMAPKTPAPVANVAHPIRNLKHFAHPPKKGR